MDYLYAIAALVRTLPEEQRVAIRVLMNPDDKVKAVLTLLRTLTKEELEEVLEHVPTRDVYPGWPDAYGFRLPSQSSCAVCHRAGRPRD